MYRIVEDKLSLDILQELEVMVFGNTRSTETRVQNIRNSLHLLLIAYDESRPIGFKLGYAHPENGSFYSWLGGVDPDYRRQGIAQRLLDIQEKWARSHGFATISFATYDRFPHMIALGKKNGFVLSRIQKENGERKYWYEKNL